MRQSGLPFKEYTVELGHENQGRHDIVAAINGNVLHAEAFNVAKSFFPTKKAAAIKKLRNSTARSDYRFIVCNEDSVTSAYAPKPEPGEYFLFVDISDGTARTAPKLAPTFKR